MCIIKVEEFLSFTDAVYRCIINTVIINNRNCRKYKLVKMIQKICRDDANYTNYNLNLFF